MEWPAGAVWMVGIGLVGLAGTGVAYYVEQMPDGPAESSAFNDPIPKPDFLDKEPKSPSKSSTTTAPVEPEPEPEPDQCRALLNVRLASGDPGLYDYQVVDLRFKADGQIRYALGKGLAMRTEDGFYSLQGNVDVGQGVPQHSFRAYSHAGDGRNETPLWTYPDTKGGLLANEGVEIGPVYQQRTRVRATIDPYVALHREVVVTEGGMREESGLLLDVRSGKPAQPLRLNMSAIEGRAAAFAHRKAANYEGSEEIWRNFIDTGEGEFLLRLANGPGKSIEPEVGVCCYEREGISKMVFARLDRGAFALMAPGYLSRSHGLVRAGDGCGEFGWDGSTVYARRRDGGPWKPLAMELGKSVEEFLGVYWLPYDSDYDVLNQPSPPRLPGQRELSRMAENAEKLGRQAHEAGQNDTAVRQLRKALRIKTYLGEPVDGLKPVYDEAVAQRSQASPPQPSESGRR